MSETMHSPFPLNVCHQCIHLLRNFLEFPSRLLPHPSYEIVGRLLDAIANDGQQSGNLRLCLQCGTRAGC